MPNPLINADAQRAPTIVHTRQKGTSFDLLKMR
ncbi:hypothetical protein EV582_1505 [Duganella sp. BK701]|nr:hypothetical protein EV582_1505 [Duganella sp. BK701]